MFKRGFATENIENILVESATQFVGDKMGKPEVVRADQSVFSTLKL